MCGACTIFRLIADAASRRDAKRNARRARALVLRPDVLLLDKRSARLTRSRASA
jgi:hypothetical protein